MRKTWFILLMLAIMLLFCACAEQVQEDDTPSDLEESDDPDYSRTKIGFSLAGTGAFYDQLSSDIISQCEALGYEANIVTADTGDKQQQDISAMLSAGTAVIVIDPVDVDVLESVLADCELSGIPVVNIIDSINGKVSTLISPDYSTIGEMAGQQAVALLSDAGGKCLELKSDYDSFIMQLMSDGFESVLIGNENVVIASDVFCGSDEEKAYQAAKEQIAGGNADFIFAHNASLARGALRAIEESGQTIHLFVFGGEMDLLQSVQSGKIDGAVFFGTKELAEIAIGVADEFIKSATYEPIPYIELSVDATTAENVSGYISQEHQYAQVKEE